MTTQVTPNGVSYTLRETDLGGSFGGATFYMDDTKLTDAKIPLIIYIHGTAGNKTTLFGANQEYQRWAREFFIEQGCAVLEADGGPIPYVEGGHSGERGWAGPNNRAAYIAAIDWVTTEIDVGPMVSYSFSMGGILNYWLASRSPYADRIQGMIVHCGTTDLVYRYVYGQLYEFFNIAYGIEPVSVRLPANEFASVVADYDPMNFDESVWQGRRVLQIYGDLDGSVPWDKHGEKWVFRYAEHTAETRVVEDTNVGHWQGPKGLAAIKDFTTEVITVPEEPEESLPGAAWIAESVHLVGAGRELLPVSVIA